MENIRLDLPAAVSKGMSYEAYLGLIDQLLLKGMTTGPEQSEERLAKAELNRHRMKRLDKTAVLSQSLQDKLINLNGDYLMLVLTEGWCGDAAQSLPWLNQIAMNSGGKLNACYLLRDENPGLMDLFLTSGSRSIPKVVFLSKQDGCVLKTWGPRPTRISDMWGEMKKQGDLSKEEMAERLHKWYADEKGAAIMEDFESILDSLNPLY